MAANDNFQRTKCVLKPPKKEETPDNFRGFNKIKERPSLKL
jgi:hypothetical protein